LLFLLSIPVGVQAQGGATGAMSGTVQDSSGAVVQGATVTIVNTATGESIRAERTNAAGFFTVTLLRAGTYNVRVESPNFAVEELRDVTVRATETTRLTATLKVKTVTESAEVQSEAVTVKTTDATTGESMAGQSIRELPLATRNFQQLLATNAGASSSLNSAAQLGRGDVRINVNGGREDNNSYQIDGIGANDPTNGGELAYTPLPSPDSIQEFKVSTSLYDATQGRNGGGNINAVLKSGTLKYHFDVFEYFRNTDLDANDFFLKSHGLARPDIKQNIFGGSLGGPVGPKAQLGFFFVNYQGTRQRSGDSPGTIISTQIPYVPAADRVAGNAAATQLAIQNDANCLAGSGLATADPMMAALMAIQSNQFGPKTVSGGYLFPVPQTNVPAGTTCGQLVPFAISLPGKFNDDQFTANWDREFRAGKDHLSERFFFSDAATNEPFGADGFALLTGYVPTSNNLNFAMNIPVRDRYGSLTETHIFTNRLVNEARFGASVISWSFHNIQPMDLSTGKPVNVCDPIFVNAFASSSNTGCAGLTGAGIVRLSTIGVSTDIPRLFISNSGTNFGPHPMSPLKNLADNLSFVDTLSYVRGAHSIRVGAEIDHTGVRKNIPIADNGYWLFGNMPSMLAGNLAFGLTGSGLSTHDYKSPALAGFFQDDYRVTKSLTLNLGFRAEFDGAPTDALCHISNIDFNLANPNSPNYTGEPFVYPKCADKLAAQYGLTGVTGTTLGSGLSNNYAFVAAPRIGFAYDVRGRNTTSIRGGYGIYTVREDTGALDNLALLPPFAPSLASFGPQVGGLANLYNTAQNPGNSLPVVGQTNNNYVPQASFFLAPNCNLNTAGCAPSYSGNIPDFGSYLVPSHWIIPTTQQWNLSVQRSIAGDWAVEVGYVGTKGTHLRAVSETDQPAVASPANPVVVEVYSPSGTPTGQKVTIMQNTVANAAARAPYQGIFPGNVEDFAPNGTSNYNSLQTTVTHRFANRLYFQSAYTFSKSIDDTSTAQVAYISRFNDQYKSGASRATSDFDRRQRWINTFTYALPFFAKEPGFVHKALSDWDVSGVFTVQSGTPFSVTDSKGGAAFPQPFGPILVTPTFARGFNCGNAFTHGSVSSRLGGYLNRAAFLNDAPLDQQIGNPLGVADPTATGFGDVPRNCFYGPRQFNVDFSLGKVFRVTERQSLKFSVEFFNLTNTTSFANPTPANNIIDINSVSPTSSTFGPITSIVGTPRLIQFALRYSY
jgi:hypothetical protein